MWTTSLGRTSPDSGLSFVESNSEPVLSAFERSTFEFIRIYSFEIQTLNPFETFQTKTLGDWKSKVRGQFEGDSRALKGVRAHSLDTIHFIGEPGPASW